MKRIICVTILLFLVAMAIGGSLVSAEESIEDQMKKWDHVEGELVITFKSGMTEEEQREFLDDVLSGITVAGPFLSTNNMYVAKVGEENIPHYYALVAQSDLIQYVTLNWIYESDQIVGDVSGDKQVNAQDFLLLKRHVLKTYTLTDPALAVADINGDENVNAQDYLLLKRLVLKTWTLAE